MPQPAQPAGTDKRLSPTVRTLGIVSFLADVSSEMVYPLNPLFLTTVLGAPAWALGLIEGVAESTASLLKLYSGWLSDRLGRRKPPTVAGYALGAAGKPLVALAGAWWQVLAARFVDRLGKGLRTAPRDALIAESCPEEIRGRAFGFHRAMDTAGAVLGPLLGYWLLATWLHGTERQRFGSLYWIAFVPGILAAALVWIGVRERGRTPVGGATGFVPDLRRLGPGMRRYLFAVGIFSIGNSSDAFLILRAQQDMGIQPAQVFLLYALFNVVEASLGYPAGILSDRVGRKRLLATGWWVFCLVYLGFATLASPAAAVGLFVLYGLYYTLTQGMQRALAADLAHAERRATELGAFHMVVGLLALPASQIAGVLYGVDHRLPFALGAVTAACGSILLSAFSLDKPSEVVVD